MKHYLFLLSALWMANVANAQFRVNPNGNIAIQTEAVPVSTISIGDEGRNDFYFSTNGSKGSINSSVIGSKLNWSNAGQFFSALSSENNFCIGLRAETRDLNNTDGKSHRSFGVMGLAGNATSGWNYGIYGKILGKNNGASIYGTTSDDNGIYLNNRYAGYFNGLVGINGNLHVDGTIDGIFIGESAEMTNIASTQGLDAQKESSVDKLAGLTAIPYYKGPNSQVAMQSNTEGDTIATQQELSDIAVQDLTKKHFALSAEQLEASFPDLVYTKKDGTKGINYMEMIPLLVQSINELNTKITKLENEKRGIKTIAANKTASINTNGIATASLAQNTPNPFEYATSIKTVIPQDTKESILYVCDMTGKQVKKVTISERGNVDIQFTTDGLDAGMYLYSLAVDGKIVDTKRMIINK